MLTRTSTEYIVLLTDLQSRVVWRAYHVIQPHLLLQCLHLSVHPLHTLKYIYKFKLQIKMIVPVLLHPI